mgnify:CR=1 FL=1
MTLEELKKEAIDYANKWLEEVKNLEIYHNKADPKPKYIRIKEAYIAGAEPREKQIEIDAEQIRVLQKQNGELTDKVKELETENAFCKEACEGATMMYEHLTKAKELLKQLVNIEYAVNIPKEKIISIRVKAEQFLMEIGSL